MADENIVVGITANSNFSDLVTDINKVSASLARMQQTLVTTDKSFVNQVAKLNAAFSSALSSSGQFSTHFVSLQSDAEKFGKSLDSGKLKLRDYFNTLNTHVKTNGGLIRDLAKQQAALQNAVIQPLGKNAQGLMQYNIHVARGIDEIANKTKIAAQQAAIMNKVVQQGANQLINWGKNTQWAGRQLTVGLTVPMLAFGKAAADAFNKADQELVRLTKVYGGVAAVSASELGKVRKEVSATAKELASSYGASYQDTLSLAADIAATGKTGNELVGSIRETTRLAVLGEVDRQDAMKATLAIQTAFKQNTSELTQSINFLNAVENQTSTTLADLIEAIPKAGPVIKGLGGSVKDLALYLTAMKEGGITAAEGANALKSGLASLINPTNAAVNKFKTFGIDLLGIVNNNAGNVTGTILALQSALDNLDPLKKQQAIEQLFGKFQFARMNALFSNLGKQGSQTLQVLDLMKASSQDLAKIAGRELSQVTESASGKYRRALEGLKADLAGVGDQFLNINTHLLNFVDKIIKFASNLPAPIKSIMGFLGGLTAIAGPLIMLTGVLGNFFGYIIKGVSHFRALFKGAEGWKLLTPEILAANQAGNLMEATFYNDSKAATVLKTSISNLINELSILEAKAQTGSFSTSTQVTAAAQAAMMMREVDPRHPLVGSPYTRASAHMVPRASMTAEQKQAQTFFGMVPSSIPVNQRIGENPMFYSEGNVPPVAGLTTVETKRGPVSTGILASEASKWHAMNATLAMMSKSELAELKKNVMETGVATQVFTDTFDSVLPAITGITTNAAKESAAIVSKLKAGEMSVEAARAEIVALNLRIEQELGQTATMLASESGRSINLGKVPTLNQPVVDAAGKSNMRELFKKSGSRNFINKLASVLGVRTSGAGYNVETTRMKKFNLGNIVPGTGNTDTVPAMLTPGEFVVNKKATAANLPLLQQINNGKGGRGPGFSNGGFINSAITNAYLALFGKQSRSNKEAKLLGRWGMIMPQSVNDALAMKLGSRGASGSSLIALMNEPARLIDMADFLSFNGVPDHEIDSILSNTARKISSRIDPSRYYNDNAFGNLSLNSIDQEIAALESRYPGLGLKYQKDRMTPGRRDTIKRRRWLEDQNRFETQKEANSRGGGSPTGINLRGDRPSNYRTARNKLYGEKQVWGHFYDRQFAQNLKIFSKLFLRRNLGGIIPGYMNGNIVKPLGKAILSRLTKNWGRVASSGVYNQDPLHGPLHIGTNASLVRNQSPFHSAETLESFKYGLPRKINYGNMEFGEQFPIGSEREQALYALNQYMQGYNSSFMSLPSVKRGLAGMASRYSGKAYRGFKLNSKKSKEGIPDHIAAAIYDAQMSGDFSKLIGKKFIMRSSSWSQSPDVASKFADIGKYHPADLMGTTFEVQLDNKNVLNASSIFPNIGFDASGKWPGQNKESELLFGGAFQIVKAGPGKIVLSTAPGGIQKREFGGNVNTGKPYLVGEKGPELFVPGKSGAIVPHFKLGGMVGQTVAGLAGSMVGQNIGQKLGGDLGGTAGNILGFMLPSLLMGRGKGAGEAAEGLGKFASITSKLPASLKGTLFGISRLNIALAGVTTAALLGYKAFKTYQENQKIQALQFGMSADAAAKAGFKVTDYAQRMKDAVAAAKALKERNIMLYESMTQSNTPLKMTIEQYKKLRSEVKSTMGDYIKLFDKTKNKDLITTATNLKAQFISMGDSAEVATAKIYAMLAQSNKAGMAKSVIGNNQFSSINTVESAAARQTKTFGAAQQVGTAKSQANALFTAFQAYDSLSQKQLNSIIKSMGKQKALSRDLINEIAKQNPELGKILNTTDDITTAWYKYKLVTAGVVDNVDKLSGKAAKALYELKSVVDQQTLASLKSTGGKFGVASQFTLLDQYNSKIKKLQSATKGQSVQQQISDKTAIKNLQKQIDLINKAADDKIKALRKVNDAENAQLEIQQAQLEYRSAIARGDRDAAAQAQIRIQQISKERQLKTAEDRITANADKATAPLQAKIDAINAKQEALGDKAALAGEQLGTLQTKAQNLSGSLEKLTTAAQAVELAKSQGITGKPLEILIKAVDDALKPFGKEGMGKSLTDSIYQALKNNKIVADKVEIYANEVKNSKNIKAEVKTTTGPRQTKTYSIQYDQLPPKTSQAVGTVFTAADGKKYEIIGGADRSGAIPLTPKAKGGSVLKNTAYLVGEKGPELFLPSMAGSIIPNNKLSAMYNIPSSNWGISGTAENSGGVYNSTYNVKIELNGTNLSADDVYNKFEQKLAMLNAKQGRNKTIGGR